MRHQRHAQKGMFVQNFLCVEPAVAASGPIQLQPGQSWSGTQILTLET